MIININICPIPNQLTSPTFPTDERRTIPAHSKPPFHLTSFVPRTNTPIVIGNWNTGYPRFVPSFNFLFGQTIAVLGRSSPSFDLDVTANRRTLPQMELLLPLTGDWLKRRYAPNVLIERRSTRNCRLRIFLKIKGKNNLQVAKNI